MLESPNYPGQVTTMLGLLKFTHDFSKAQGVNKLWYKDIATTESTADNNGFAARHAYLIQSPTVKGTFSFRIPMKHIFGFCEDYDKIMYSLKHSLTLVRKTDDDAMFRAEAADAGKVSIDKISWFMPHVIPSDAEKFSIYKLRRNRNLLLLVYKRLKLAIKLKIHPPLII